MKKLVVLFALVSLLSSCDSFKKTDDERFNSLKRPVIVVGKSDPNIAMKNSSNVRYSDLMYRLEINCTITLKDSRGTFATFDGAKGIGASLYSTYNVKDTIK